MECYYTVWSEGRPTGTTIGGDPRGISKVCLSCNKAGPVFGG